MNLKQEQEVILRINKKLTENVELKRVDDEKLLSMIEVLIDGQIKDNYCSVEQKISIVKKVFDLIRGYGLLNFVMVDKSITNIEINYYNNIYITQNKTTKKLNVEFNNVEDLNDYAVKLLALSGIEYDRKKTIYNAYLPNGVKLNIIFNRITNNVASICITKPVDTEGFIDINSLIDNKIISRNLVLKLEGYVKSKKNIVITGYKNSDKTLILNFLVSFLPTNERVAYFEKVKQLKIIKDSNSFSVTTDNNSNESILNEFDSNITERVVIDGFSLNYFDLYFKMIDEGCIGSMITCNLGSIEECILKLELLLSERFNNVNRETIKQYVNSNIDIIISLEDKVYEGALIKDVVEIQKNGKENYIYKSVKE